MTLIVGLSTIVLFILGYYIMDHIDQFIQNNVGISNKNLCHEKVKDREEKNRILIYGKNELTELVEDYCNSQRYEYQQITDVCYIDPETKYRCLLALSYNDADNLTVSSIGFKIYSISNVTALCNNQENLKMYKEFSVHNVLLYDDIDKVFGMIKGLVEDGNKNKNKI